jgi:hypothetical protein
VICSISKAVVNERNTSFRIVMSELTANRTLDMNMGIQNSLPTFKYLMAFRVLQPSTHRDVEITQKAMFDIIINQFTFIPQVFSIKIYDNHFGI